MKCQFCDEPAVRTCDYVTSTARESLTKAGDFPRCRKPVCRAHARTAGAPGTFDPGAVLEPMQPFTTCPDHRPEGAL